MTLEELKELIAADEGETLEVKETTGQRRDACETLCAFLNKDGGTVVFGVTRKGRLTGQLMADTTKRDLFDAFQKFEPAAGLPVPEVKEEYGCVTTVFKRPDWTGDNTPDRRTGIVAARTGTASARTGTTHRLSGTVWAITGTTGAIAVEDALVRLPKLRKDARMNVETVLHELIADRNATIPQICARTGMALRTINNALATLRGAGILKAKGDEGHGIVGDCDKEGDRELHIGGEKRPFEPQKPLEKPLIEKLSVKNTGTAANTTARTANTTVRTANTTPLPKDLEEDLAKLKGKAPAEVLSCLIVRLCSCFPMTNEMLQTYLKRGKVTINKLVAPLIGKRIDYLFPMMPHHPNQAYVALKGPPESNCIGESHDYR